MGDAARTEVHEDSVRDAMASQIEELGANAMVVALVRILIGKGLIRSHTMKREVGKLMSISLNKAMPTLTEGLTGAIKEETEAVLLTMLGEEYQQLCELFDEAAADER